MILIWLLICLFLLSTAILTAVSAAFRNVQLHEEKSERFRHHFFYSRIHRALFPGQEEEGVFFASVSAQNVSRFFFAAAAALFLINSEMSTFFLIASILLLLFASVFLGDCIPRILGNRYPENTMRYTAFFASILMTLSLPFTFLAIRFAGPAFRTIYAIEPITRAKKEMIELIQKSHLSPDLTNHEKELIGSMLTFKERIAREVMVPRVDVFTLSADTPIRDAARLISEEGFSRIPIYRNSVDNIIGVILYKDILDQYIRYAEKDCDSKILEAPVETIQKSILYTPETKKISNLLLEFRKKQSHLAIVVDEYGGTEGVVTIEDILEEIVGEIADEYDEEEDLFISQPDGSWIVDARLSILDAEEQLSIRIPQEGDYDTVGGFIFHSAGSIPPVGFVIHQEQFEMEVLRTDERRVLKVKIKTRQPGQEGG